MAKYGLVIIRLTVLTGCKLLPTLKKNVYFVSKMLPPKVAIRLGCNIYRR